MKKPKNRGGKASKIITAIIIVLILLFAGLTARRILRQWEQSDAAMSPAGSGEGVQTGMAGGSSPRGDAAARQPGNSRPPADGSGTAGGQRQAGNQRQATVVRAAVKQPPACGWFRYGRRSAASRQPAASHSG